MAVTDEQVFQWFQDNPGATDAQIAQAAAAAGVSASQLSRVTGVPVSEVVSRVAATDTGTLSPPAAATDAPKSLAELTSNRYEDYLNANPDVKAEFEKFSAQDPGKWTPESYAAYHLTNYGLGEGRTGGDFQSSVDVLAKQILAQGTTSKWAGEGFGSAEKNAADMAKILAAHGITDISQFGEIKQTVQGEPIYGGSGDDPVLLGYGPDKVITTYGNKETGQALTNTYGERQTDNAWGGTYAGEGNTAYRVQFDAQGNPIFYTTGASSSDVGDLAPLLAIGSMLVAPGLSGFIGGATGLTGGALAAATGATLGAATSALTGNDILKGALLGGGTGYLSSLLSSGVTDTDLLQQAADADMAAGMLPEYGTNAAYDAAMADLMANSPGAIAQLENIVNSQVGGTLGPDNIDVGGGWNPADSADFSMEVTADRPVVDYSNEGLNYPGTAITTGAGGSPANASIVTTTPSLNDVLNVVKAGTAVAGLVGGASALNEQPTGFEIVPVPSDWKTPTYGQTGQWPALTPIDFGSRELLRGTQWEKYINPAQPVTPVQAPAGMNYGQLMNVLQGGQGGNLSLNDIISGIQSQYGQTNTSSMGK